MLKRAGTEFLPGNKHTGTVRSALSSLSHLFSLRLWQAAAPPFGQHNICISPLNVYLLLLMVAAGAEGATKEQLLNLLGLAGTSDSDIVTQFEKFRLDLFTVPAWMQDGHFAEWRQANAMFCRMSAPVSMNYRGMCNRWFGTDVKQADFAGGQAVETINQWSAQQTNNHIPTVLNAVPPELNCLLSNVIFFFDQWEQPFSFEDSTYRPFHLPDGRLARVDTMCKRGMVRLCENDFFQAVRLAYKDPRFSLYCFMPRENISADHILAFLNEPTWTRQFADEALELWLPRFRFGFQATLRQTLMNAGITELFMRSANLSRIAPDFYVDELLQQTMLRVDEVGVEAASHQSGPARFRPRKTVCFDRPFLFLLRHEFAASPLLIGTVANPQC